MNASTALLQALLTRGDYLESLSQIECLKILPILESAHDEILGKIAKTHGVWTREWLQEMAGEIDEIYKAACEKGFIHLKADLEKLAINEGAWVSAETSKAIKIDWSLTAPAPSLLKAVLDLPTSIGGSTLEDLFDALAINSRKAAYGAISDGMLAGDTVEQMTRRLRGEVVKRATWRTIDGKRTYVPGQYEGGALEDVSTRQARTLARTAVMHVGNQARETFYKANEDIIKGYQRVETLDQDTCLACGADDGHVYGLDEPRPELPIHPDCRGVYVPVLKSFRELGLDMDEFPEGTRASMDGQVAESETYADRLAKATPAQRVAMLGPGRAALYEKGLSLEDMVKDGAAVPLKDLAAPKRKGQAA